MARDDARGEGGNGGGGDTGGGAGSGPPSGPPLGTARIQATIPDARALSTIRQMLDTSNCVTINTTVQRPDGGEEYHLDAVCPDDVTRLVTDFIFRTLSERPDAGPRPRDTLRPQEEIRRNRLDERLARGERVADLLLNPPDTFGAASRDLASRVAEKLQAAQFLGKTIVVGVVLILATQSPAETLATQGFDLEGVTEALRTLPTITKAQIVQLIELDLLVQPSRFPPDERRWWSDLDRVLQ
jgi:hypothetical protein